jgi:excisionase family DNA binding protein
MMHGKQFLSPSEIATELGISSTTVLRLIHAGELPAIRVSERIYRIPNASFEMYKAGTLQTPEVSPLGGRRPRPVLGKGEELPTARRSLASHAR